MTDLKKIDSINELNKNSADLIGNKDNNVNNQFLNDISNKKSLFEITSIIASQESNELIKTFRNSNDEMKQLTTDLLDRMKITQQGTNMETRGRWSVYNKLMVSSKICENNVDIIDGVKKTKADSLNPSIISEISEKKYKESSSTKSDDNSSHEKTNVSMDTKLNNQNVENCPYPTETTNDSRAFNFKEHSNGPFKYVTPINLSKRHHEFNHLPYKSFNSFKKNDKIHNFDFSNFNTHRSLYNSEFDFTDRSNRIGFPNSYHNFETNKIIYSNPYDEIERSIKFIDEKIKYTNNSIQQIYNDLHYVMNSDLNYLHKQLLELRKHNEWYMQENHRLKMQLHNNNHWDHPKFDHKSGYCRKFY